MRILLHCVKYPVGNRDLVMIVAKRRGNVMKFHNGWRLVIPLMLHICVVGLHETVKMRYYWQLLYEFVLLTRSMYCTLVYRSCIVCCLDGISSIGQLLQQRVEMCAMPLLLLYVELWPERFCRL